jgi:hypothetical protein
MEEAFSHSHSHCTKHNLFENHPFSQPVHLRKGQISPMFMLPITSE